MFLAALLDAGVSQEHLLGELNKIAAGQYEFRATRVLRSGLASNHIEFIIPEKQPHRHLSHIEKMLTESTLSATVKEKAIAIFRKLAEAEGKLHSRPPESVHFHEVGAVDAILDIAGACAGLELLGVTSLYCSPLNVGGGHVQAAHGTLPVPAPATAELLIGLPVYSSGVEGELVTPTGAAIVSALATAFGPMPPMKVEQIGYGAGTSDFPGHPNIARLLVGEAETAMPQTGGEDPARTVSVIQANVDDMNPQLYGYLVDRALQAGALDITCSAIQMKKNRPGLEVSMVCPVERTEALASLLFAETTTLGLRISKMQRMVLDREIVKVETAYGAVRVKVARRDGPFLNATPEYEDCRRIASEKSVPLKEVILAAQVAFRKLDH